MARCHPWPAGENFAEGPRGGGPAEKTLIDLTRSLGGDHLNSYRGIVETASHDSSMLSSRHHHHHHRVGRKVRGLPFMTSALEGGRGGMEKQAKVTEVA